jgi:hypothetical protein
MHNGWYFFRSSQEAFLREAQYQETKKNRSCKAVSNEKEGFLR